MRAALTPPDEHTYGTLTARRELARSMPSRLLERLFCLYILRFNCLCGPRPDSETVRLFEIPPFSA